MNLYGKCEEFVNEITDGLSMGSCGSDIGGLDINELNVIRRNVLMYINDAFNEKIKSNGTVSYIAADSATVEVVDHESGICYRRELPLRYEETGNGVSLIGEDITGKNSQISFLSEAAYEKIKDLTGKGPDAPVCGGHDA